MGLGCKKRMRFKGGVSGQLQRLVSRRRMPQVWHARTAWGLGASEDVGGGYHAVAALGAPATVSVASDGAASWRMALVCCVSGGDILGHVGG